MLLSSSSRKESLPQTSTPGSTPGGMPASGVFFRSTTTCPCLSQRLPLAEHPDALSRAGEILLPVGYLPHFFLREAQHVIRFHFDRDGCPVCIQRVRNLVCEDWQIRT